MSRRKGLTVTVACAALIGLLTFGWAIWQSEGFFTLVADFNEQQLPFAAAAWEGIHSGASWLWGVDLGASLVTTFSFYNLGSPFFWITLLFPKESFPALVGGIFILKYMTAAATSYAYLRRLTRNDTAVIGALLYTFSGFQATNLMFYHFHDVVAFFPLLLVGLEEYLTEDRKSGFIFAAFLNCLVNYFFFLQETVFLILYFVFRLWGRTDLRKAGRKAMGCLFCGAWGVCMAGILFLPSMIYVAGSERSGVSLSLSKIFYSPADLLHILKGILLPGDTMESLSAVQQYNFDSTSAYLPLFGVALALAYVLRKRDGLGRLLLLLAVLSFFPLGNGIFLLLTGVYQRWWFMWTLMMALATGKVLERLEDYPVRRGIWIQLGMIALFSAALWLLAHREESGIHIYDGLRLRLQLGIGALGALLLLLLLRGQPSKWLLLGLTCVFCAGTTGMTLYAYRAQEWSAEKVRQDYEVGLQLETPDPQYRFASAENLLMMTGNAGGYGAFSSTAENGSYRFNQLMDCYFVSNTSGRILPWLPELLGAKYEVQEGAPPEDAAWRWGQEGREYFLSEREACPIGFAVDWWIREQDLRALPREERPVVLMNAFVAEEAMEASLREKNTPRMQAAEFTDLDPEESIRRTVKNAVGDFVRTGDGFRCRTAWDQARYVYFTVPYDQGWMAQVDGERQQILDSGGMMVLFVPAGEHSVTFTYQTPGFRAGMTLSAVCSLLFVLFLLQERRRRNGLRGQAQGGEG